MLSTKIYVTNVLRLPFYQINVSVMAEIGPDSEIAFLLSASSRLRPCYKLVLKRIDDVIPKGTPKSFGVSSAKTQR